MVLHESWSDFRFKSCCIAPGKPVCEPGLLTQHDSGNVWGLNLPSLNQISYGFLPWFLTADCESVNGNTPQHCNYKNKNNYNNYFKVKLK